MAIKSIKQINFDGGLTENARDTSGNRCFYTENVLLDKGLVSQAVNNLAANSCGYTTTWSIIKIIQYGTTLFGLGRNTANDDIVIYKKTIGSGNNWALVQEIVSTSLSLDDPFFIAEADAVDPSYCVLYLIQDASWFAKYETRTTTLTTNAVAANGTKKGGVAWKEYYYYYVGQTIWQFNIVTPLVTDKIIIPTGQTIVQLVPYGNLLGIVCSSSVGDSKMYLWDGKTTDSFVDIIDIGVGDVFGGNILDGIIYVLVSNSNRKGFRLRAYSGGRFITVYNYGGRANRARTYNLTQAASQVKIASNHLYFLVIGTRSDSEFSGTYEAQMFRYGKISPESPNSLSCVKTFFSDGTSTNTPDVLRNDFVVFENSPTQAQQQMLATVLYNLAGANTSYYYEMSTTYNATEDTTSSASAVIETVIYNGGDSHIEKQLNSACLFTDGMPAAGSVTLKYKKDGDINKAAATWTTLFTNTTDEDVSHATSVIESDGTNLPIFKEIQFRIEMSGDAKLSGLKLRYEELQEKDY